MECKVVNVFDNDENSIVELVEGDNGKKYIRRTMQGRVEVYLALKKLPHNFLPEIVSAEYDGKQTVVIEEYITGRGDLSCLKTESELVAAFGELCEVLEFIHTREIIHRDIKPSNVLVANDGHIRLIDFDAARRYKEDSPNDTRYLGTKGYAAPEQFGFSQTDCTADIYALGVTMKAVMGSIADSRKYRNIIRKCTEFDPKNRYKSAADVKASLVLGKYRYYIESAAALLVCAVIALGANLLLNRQGSNSDVISAAATVTETVAVSETTMPQTVVTATIAEITTPQTEVTTTVPETTTTAVTIPETSSEIISEELISETTSASTSSEITASTTVPATEAENITEVSFSLSEAMEVSDESFELISPRNEKLVPKVARKEITEGFYTDYFVDEYRFIKDTKLVGKWISVAKMDTFDPKLIKEYFFSRDKEHVKNIEIGNIQAIEFGKDSLCFSSYNTYASISKWTYGAIMNDYYIDAASISGYYIYRADGVDYLFVEGKLDDRDLKDDRTAQNCVVFQRLVIDEDKPYNAAETTKFISSDIIREIISPTDESKLAKFEKRLAEDGNYYDFYDDEYKFVSDPKIVGEWIAVDYTEFIDSWTYDSNKSTDDLYLKKIDFKADGRCLCTPRNNTFIFEWRWTYGQIMTPDGKYCLVDSYQLCDIDGEEFLMVEYKNGDYMRNENWDPGWYIFKKV